MSIQNTADLPEHPLGGVKSSKRGRPKKRPPPDSEIALVVKPKRAGEMLDKSPPKIYQLINAGLLESFKDGVSRKITVRSIHKYIADQIAAKHPKKRMPRSPGRPRRRPAA